jgi:hypothetical protein
MFPQKMSLFSTIAIVPLLSVRVQSANALLLLGFPALLGVCYGAWQYGTGKTKLSLDDDIYIVRQSLFTLVLSWMAWYLLLSIGWSRYLFVPVFVGSMFVAVMLHDLTSGLSIPATVKSAADTILRLRFNRSNIFSLVVVLLFALVPITVINIYLGYASSDRSSREVAEFLNTATPPDALIETYDMEIFLLLNRRYSHPSDDVHLRVIRQLYLDQNVEVDYDPMAADPDYLIVGPIGRLTRIYEPILQTGSFRLILEGSRYQVYERVRAKSS